MTRWSGTALACFTIGFAPSRSACKPQGGEHSYLDCCLKLYDSWAVCWCHHFTLRSGVLVDLGRVPVRGSSPPPATKERMSILRPGTPSYDSRPMFLLIFAAGLIEPHLLRLIASPAPRRSRTRPGKMSRRPGTRITVLGGNLFFRRARPSIGCLQVGNAQHTGHERIDAQVHAGNARPGAL